MSGVHRFLSKRDKSQTRKHHHHGKHQTESAANEAAPKPANVSSAVDFYGLFDSPGKVSGHAEELKVKSLRQRIIENKGVAIRDATILWAIRSHAADGNAETAYNLLLAMSDASEGMVTKYDPMVRLRGAQNRHAVTCYLDSTLFSMFSRLDSFEAMLYNEFKDLPRTKLVFLLRLWVNLLRSGQLITTDVTKIIQEALSECGWLEAAELHQQDASEAFAFITGKLELPLLTLKMDIYHTGKEDATDDHKYINERLLDVAVPEDPNGQRKEITLEDCLEDYFNNRIEVRRYLERRSTVTSLNSFETKAKGGAIHVETVEVDPDSSPATPVASSPSKPPPTRPPHRNRTQSIIQERYIPARGENNYSTLANVDTKDSSRSRAGSVRKEVMMPAWQFFSLIPWYTDNTPSNDAQVAAHFSTKRPVLGLCLKRYAVHNGQAVRLNTHVDIPVEIGLPHFIQDDPMTDDGSLHGNFKLSLQSVVCHRGQSVDSGHYVALVRATTEQSPLGSHSTEDSKRWMRFDDLASQRITLVDIETAMREEMPYLLFYQIVPVEGDPGLITAGEQSQATVSSEENNTGKGPSTTSLALSTVSNPGLSSGRPSFELPIRDDTRGRSPLEARRQSAISFSDAAAVKKETSNGSSPKRPSKSLSRTQSGTSDGLSRTLSKLTRRKSREVQADTVVAEVNVHEMSAATSFADEPRAKPNGLAVVQPPPHKSHKRERSKNRFLKNSGKGKEHKPDRECVVM